MGVDKLARRIDFLEEVIDRLQEALGIVIQVEASYKNRPNIEVVFSLKLAPVVWEEAKRDIAIKETIYLIIKHKLQTLLKEGKNGGVKEMGNPKA